MRYQQTQTACQEGWYRLGQKQKPQLGHMGHKQATWIFMNSAVRISNFVSSISKAGRFTVMIHFNVPVPMRHYSVSRNCNVHFWCIAICTSKSSGKECKFLYEHEETSKLGKKNLMLHTFQSDLSMSDCENTNKSKLILLILQPLISNHCHQINSNSSTCWVLRNIITD